MTAITLRNIPPKLLEAMRQRASTEGLSLNRTVLCMLEEAFEAGAANHTKLHHDLDHLAGNWSDEEGAAFDVALSEQSRIDPELIAAEWGQSDNNRKAKFYTLTPAGQQRLRQETDEWKRLVTAIATALNAVPEEV
jgi:hypothetical protein